MRIGVPKEIKNHEYRVGLPPAGVVELVNHGHEVMIETHAGEGAGFSNGIMSPPERPLLTRRPRFLPSVT